MTTLDEARGVTQRQSLERARARPFVKWAGGKRSLVSDIARRVPERIQGIYWEPFVGGGAVFFALDSLIRTARLSDNNPELMLAYQSIKKRPEELIALLARHAQQHPTDKDYYYQVRNMAHSHCPVEVAARLIYLNKTCYNGLYRVNKQGKFNVPKGRYANPRICDAEGIRNASNVLQKADIKLGDFSRVEPGHGDFIYCDPPYDGTFAGYTSEGFDDGEQRRLRDDCLRWHRLGAEVMVSNADTSLIRTLYGEPPFILHEVSAPRQINTKGGERGATAELLITSYEPPEYDAPKN